jgi:hypothetical protein
MALTSRNIHQSLFRSETGQLGVAVARVRGQQELPVGISRRLRIYRLAHRRPDRRANVLIRQASEVDESAEAAHLSCHMANDCATAHRVSLEFCRYRTRQSVVASEASTFRQLIEIALGQRPQQPIVESTSAGWLAKSECLPP